MEVNDLTLKVNDNGYVNVRANLILIHPEKGVLFHTLPHWNGELTLFGGRVKFAETLEEACNRELEEELGLELPIEKTWWDNLIFTNVFAKKYYGTTFHEFSGFGVYYLPKDYDVEYVEIDNLIHTCQFLPIDELTSGKYTFVPPKIGELIAQNIK
ncbi:MAG: NUDIX domain-containing protein [Culicoidibacterales bacterium]